MGGPVNPTILDALLNKIIQVNGTQMPTEGAVNFVGSNITGLDNTSNGSTDITVTAAATGWQTLLDFDFTAQSNQTIAADGGVTIGGQAFVKFGTTYEASAMAVVASTGLVITPSSSSVSIIGGGGAEHFPGLMVQLSALTFPQTLEWDQTFRLWVYYTSDLTNHSSTEQTMGLDLAPSGGLLTGNYGMRCGRASNGSGGGVVRNAQMVAAAVASSTSSSSAQTPTSANRVLVNEFRLAPLGNKLLYTGAFSSEWPDLSACVPSVLGPCLSAPNDLFASLTGVTPSSLGVFVGHSLNFGSGSASATVGRLR